MFNQPTAADRAAAKVIGEQAVTLLGREEAEYLFARLGPRDGQFASAEPVGMRLTNWVRGLFVAMADEAEDCDCNIDFGCDSGTLLQVRNGLHRRHGLAGVRLVLDAGLRWGVPHRPAERWLADRRAATVDAPCLTRRPPLGHGHRDRFRRDARGHARSRCTCRPGPLPAGLRRRARRRPADVALRRRRRGRSWSSPRSSCGGCQAAKPFLGQLVTETRRVDEVRVALLVRAIRARTSRPSRRRLGVRPTKSWRSI